MKPRRLLPLSLAGLAALGLTAVAAHAQDVSPVSPVSAPIPLPGDKPLPPDRLRTAAANPAVLPMTGAWRFRLTHGGIVDSRRGAFVAQQETITASSQEAQNPPENAFDGQQDTRWCASTKNFPEWLQADMGEARRVARVALIWEKPDSRFTFRIEGSGDGRVWTTLADRSVAPGAGDGDIALLATAPAVRYLRVLVLGGQEGHWASIRECRITVVRDGQEVTWQPPAPPAGPSPEEDAFTRTDFKDAAWDTVPVPSNWEMAGYSLPTYNAVDQTAGLYRRWVTIPASFAGKRVLWRFDGVLDGAEIYVNGRRVGYHESGYTAFDVDITEALKPGKANLFAVRVSKSTPSVDCDTGDFQTMGGIYRENYLIALPATHVQEVTVRTPLDAAYRNAALAAEVRVAGAPGARVMLTGRLFDQKGNPVPVNGLTGAARLGADGTAAVSLRAPVAGPKLWSAEKPNLYYLVLTLNGPGGTRERVEQRFGFRQVEIKNGVVLWNGRPIKCTGICRHDFWADRGFALTEANWRRDLALMKAANINAIRTSHYNHAARFLELCDEQGMYILDEVPFCWVGKIDDPSFTPYLVQRADETVARDKNRACVLAWSLGNENGYGRDPQAVVDRVKELDPTRPRFVSCMTPSSYKGQTLRDSHYPWPSDYPSFAADGGRGIPTVITENPHTFYQREANEYDPGIADLWGYALRHVWNLVWPQPTILGSFIWEWQNQGIADKNPDKTRDFWYGPGHLRQENNKGIVDAYRNPKPAWWYVREVYSPVQIAARAVAPAAGACAVPLVNRYAFTDLGELACRWTALQNGRALQSGARRIACGPGGSVVAHFPAPVGMTALRLDFTRPDGSSVIGATLAVRGAPLPTAPAGPASGGALTVADQAGVLRIANAAGEIVFDRATGTVRRWRAGGRDLLVGGPSLNLGEARERGDAPNDYFYGPRPPTLEQVHLTEQRVGDDVQVTTTGEVYPASPAPHSRLGGLVCTYTVHPNASIDVKWNLTWTGGDAHLWEAGMRLNLPKRLAHLRWSREAYFTDYPAGHLGAPTGACAAADLSFRSTKRALHWMTLTDAGGAGLALLADGDVVPLAGRAAARPGDTVLYASSAVAGVRDLSWSYVADQDIALTDGKPIGGGFILRAILPRAAK